MTQESDDRAVARILDRVDAVLANDPRVLVAIAGAPASGKSTFAEKLVTAIRQRDGADAAVLVPMDGYHLENDVLDARGLRHVKGAPQTFDAEAFLSLVRRIRHNAGATLYPLFDRAADRTVPDAGQVGADTRVVVFEGNYLLLNAPVWADLADHFDVKIMLAVPMAELRNRLIDRWLSYGFSRPDAEVRAMGNDMVNAQIVIENSAAADLTFGPDQTIVFEEG